VKPFLRTTAVSLLFFLCSSGVFPYFVTFKEQYYRLFHIHYQQAPDDIMENIYWLEQAVAADFANPKYAAARIEDETQWEKYRYLFMMHLNLKLIEQHLRLGSKWDKQAAYFYDAPMRDTWLFNIERAETCYRTALAYWDEALLWAEKANMSKFRFLFLTDIQNWEDERERIGIGKLDYAKTVNRELGRIAEVRAAFMGMDEETY
jgi:hypothetical protein